MKKVATLGLALVMTGATLIGVGLATTGTSSATQQRSSSPVPPPYQARYNALRSQLIGFAALPAHTVSHSSTVIASGLEPANGNLMHPGVLQTNLLSSATTLVHRMKTLGETGVTIQVNFPLLLSSFPDSAEYTTFYRDIAQVVHQEGMTLAVEQNPLFGNISTLPIASFYAGLTLQSYAADDHQMAQTIIDIMHPTYLSILTEPDTYTAVIHQPGIDLDSPTTGAQFVNLVMGGLQQDGTLVGGGTGSWFNPSYDQLLLAQTPIEYVDMHVFPIAQSDLTNMTSIVSSATAAHKPIVVTECWLYKESSNGSPVDNVQAAPDEQKTETYSFWEPLDQQFLTTMVRYARSKRFVFVSPFSTLNFFAYQTWTPALDAQSPPQVRAAFNQKVEAALAAGELSTVGKTYQHLAA
jgi:hypothetical protein